MVVFACYNCKQPDGKTATTFKIPDPYGAVEFECPQCGTPVIVPEKPCGECVCSAQIADENLICCMVSTKDKIMLIPFNMDAGADGVCPHFERVDDEDLDYAEEEIQDLVEELDQLDQKPKKKKEEEEDDDEFDKAFDDI